MLATSRHARIARVVLEDEVADADEVRGGAAIGHRFVEVRPLPRMRQIEGRIGDGGHADVVVDVLLEVTRRQVAAVGVIPFERQVVVRRFEWLQARIALLAGATIDAHQLVEGLSALDVTPARTADGLAVAETRSFMSSRRLKAKSALGST